MTQKLVLKDGSILNECSCGFDGEYSIWCFLKDISFAEAFQHFSSPTSFETVVYEMEDFVTLHRTTYSGLVELSAIQQERDRVNVRLKGPDIRIQKEDLPINKKGGEDDDTLRDETEN